MSAYKVGPDGNWWEAWALPGVEGRDATPEESALMAKVVWENETPAELRRLNTLLGRTFAKTGESAIGSAGQ